MNSDVDPDLQPIELAVRLLQNRWAGIFGAVAAVHPSVQFDWVDEARAQGMSPVRRADFIGGRLAARQALVAAGLVDGTISVDDDGGPIFPRGYTGSIAHKHGRAVAVVGRTGSYDGIGVDLEYDEDRDEDKLAAEVVTASEERRLLDLRAVEPILSSPATLILAAKEAVYKAAFPITRKDFSFDEVELIFASDSRSFDAVCFPGYELVSVSGSYEIVSRWIVTIAVALPGSYV